MDQQLQELKDTILSKFSDSEVAGLKRLKKQLVRQYLNLGKNVTKENIVLDAAPEEIAQTLEGKNLLVMCGGGKDSEVVLAGARALQLMMLEEYGTTFNLRVGIGRQPGMIDVYDNLEHAFDALKLKGDPSVDLFYIDGKQTQPYDKNTPIPEDVTTIHRDNALVNGHIFSGAGRRTFCDDCNKSLAGWIASGISYKDGADLFMTGDSTTELNAQIRSAVPEMAKGLEVELPQASVGKTQTQHAFELLDTVGRAHSELVHGSEEEAAARSINFEGIPDKTRFVSFFSALGYESKDRLDFLTNFLGFSFDSLMFSFTESDCGNPALMCHLYGLVAEHAHGSQGATYNDGVRMYVDYAIGKMEEKGFPAQLIDKMRERYSNDENIQQMREKVEEYASRAYHFEPEHLVAMVYAPFTEHGKNLNRYLNYLVKSEKPDGHTLLAAEGKVRDLLSSDAPPTEEQGKLAERLSDLTGLNLKQMRHLSNAGLALNNFDRLHRSNDVTEKLRETMDLDSLYIGKGQLTADGKPLVQLTIRGR